MGIQTAQLEGSSGPRPVAVMLQGQQRSVKGTAVYLTQLPGLFMLFLKLQDQWTLCNSLVDKIVALHMPEFHMAPSFKSQVLHVLSRSLSVA